MEELYIVRHGVAVPYGKEGVPDAERPLTDKGIRRTRRIGRGLHRLGVEPDRVFSSPLPRARQTADIIASALRHSERVEITEELLPGRDVSAIQAWLAQRPENRIMIVGHNPGLQDLVGELVTGGHGPAQLAEFRKGAVAAFESGPAGGLRLAWCAQPRMLRRLGE